MYSNIDTVRSLYEMMKSAQCPLINALHHIICGVFIDENIRDSTVQIWLALASCFS